MIDHCISMVLNSRTDGVRGDDEAWRLWSAWISHGQHGHDYVPLALLLFYMNLRVRHHADHADHTDQANEGGKVMFSDIFEERKESESDIDQVLEALPHDHTALQLGQALYRCRSLSWRERWHIGKHLLQFESPKLGVSVMVNEQDFAAILDRRLKHMEAMDGNQKPQPQTQMIEGSKPLPRIADGRYRRI
jgi:hypothetical protein